ncbi:hypothetical protein A2U01_0088132, partial [Trifolium medium]|nr:hypothetical protein [Trifolium medium]
MFFVHEIEEQVLGKNHREEEEEHEHERRERARNSSSKL